MEHNLDWLTKRSLSHDLAVFGLVNEMAEFYTEIWMLRMQLDRRFGGAQTNAVGVSPSSMSTVERWD